MADFTFKQQNKNFPIYRSVVPVKHDFFCFAFVFVTCLAIFLKFVKGNEKGAITDNCPIATPSIIASYLALFNILCIEKHLKS